MGTSRSHHNYALHLLAVHIWSERIAVDTIRHWTTREIISSARMRAIKMKSESQWQINIEVSVGFGSLNFNIFCPLWMCVVVRVRRRHPPFLPNLYMSIVVVFQERVQQSEKILLPLYVCSHFEEVAGRSARCAPSAAVTLCKNADCFPFIIILNLFLWMFFSLFLISIRIYF